MEGMAYDTGGSGKGKHGVAGVIMLIAGSALLFLFSLTSALYDPDLEGTLQDLSPEEKLDVITLLHSVGWLMLTLGLYLGMTAVTAFRSGQGAHYKDYKKALLAGGFMITAGLGLLSVMSLIAKHITEFEILRLIWFSAHILIGLGFMLLGQGAYAGMKEVSTLSTRMGAGGLTAILMSTIGGGMLMCIAFIFLAMVIYDFKVIDDYYQFYGTVNLLQGIGFFLFFFGIGFGMKFSPMVQASDTGSTRSGKSIISMVIVMIGGILIFVGFLVMALQLFEVDAAMDIFESTDSNKSLNDPGGTIYLLIALGFLIAGLGMTMGLWWSANPKKTDSSSRGELSLASLESLGMMEKSKPVSGQMPPPSYGIPSIPQPVQASPALIPQMAPQPGAPQMPSTPQQMQPVPGQPTVPQIPPTDAQAAPAQAGALPSDAGGWKCPGCGNGEKDGNKFCTKCGVPRG